MFEFFKKVPKEVYEKELSDIQGFIETTKQNNHSFLLIDYTEWKFPQSKARMQVAKYLRKHGYTVTFSTVHVPNSISVMSMCIQWEPTTSIIIYNE